MEKEIIQIQIALFFANDFTGKYEDLSLNIKNKIGESSATMQLPIPIDSPSDIPRLTLNYENFNINIAKNRIDFFTNNFTINKSKISDIAEVILEKNLLKIGRLGFVKHFFVNNNFEYLKLLLPATKIANLNLKEAGIKINSIKLINNFNCNNIENWANSKIKTKENIEKEGLIIIRDINTLSEEIENNTKKLDKSTINTLLDSFNNETEILVF